jgi:hypothetical protein
LPAKVRVHELARALDVPSAAVLAECRRQGEYVTSASSTLEPAVVQRLRIALDRTEPALPEPTLPEPSADDQARAEQALRAFLERASSADPTEKAVEEQIREDWAPPFRAPTVAAREAVRGLPPRPGSRYGTPPRRSGRPLDPGLRPAPTPPASPVERLALDLARGNRRLAGDYAQALCVWLARDFALEDVRPWLRAGLSVHDWGLAERCREAGLSAADLATKVAGVRVVARLRGGESPESLATRLEGRMGSA